METKPLHDRVAVVTGAGRGIGRHIALGLAGMGARVVLAARSDSELRAVQAEIDAAGGEAAVIATDMSRKADVVRLVEQTVERLGALHILVANAGICPMTPLEMISEEEWDQVLTVNLKGTFLACQAALPHLRHAGKLGRVVILSSIAGQSGGMSAPAHYAASKAGLLGLTKLFAQRLAPDGVTVNCVSPATVESDLTSGWSPEFLASLAARIPLGRLGKPEEVAAAVCYLVSDSAAFITGATLDINGGVYLR